MSLSRNLGSFADVEAVLTACLQAGGGQYRLPTHKDAWRWRSRAHRFRALLLELKRKEYEMAPGLRAHTPYDNLVLRVPRAGEHNDNVVTIEVVRPSGSLTDLAGRAVTLDEGKPDDALLEQAKRFAQELDI